MKRFLVVALAVVMAICSLTMTGCSLLEKIGIGKEGVSFEEFSEKAKSLETLDPVLTSGTAYFKFSGDEDFGPDIRFEFDEEGELTISKSNFDMYYSGVHQIIELTLSSAVDNFAWTVTETEEKDEKTERGDQFKTTVVYETKNEFSVKIIDYMKTVKGNEAESISYKKFDARTGYLVEHYSKSNSGTEVTLKIDWDK